MLVFPLPVAASSPLTLPGIVNLRLVGHDLGGSAVIEGRGQVCGQLSWRVGFPQVAGIGMLVVGRVHSVTLNVKAQRVAMLG
jgi:hypothetical protein